MNPKVALHDANGIIKLVEEDNGLYSEDGNIDNNGYTIARIYTLGNAKDIGEFIDMYVWCFDTSQWKEVPKKPNIYAFWDTSTSPHQWSWDTNELLRDIRLERNKRLATTDWMFLSDIDEIDKNLKDSVIGYRQQLRDITNNLSGQENSLQDVNFPENPLGEL